MNEEITNIETTTAPSTPPAQPSLPSYKIINLRTLSVRPSYKPSHRGAPEELIQEFIITGDHSEDTVQKPQPPPGSVCQQPPENNLQICDNRRSTYKTSDKWRNNYK